MTQTQECLNKLLIDFYKTLNHLNMTQTEAAINLNVTRSHLNKVLNRRTTPSLKLIQKMEHFCYGK